MAKLINGKLSFDVKTNYPIDEMIIPQTEIKKLKELDMGCFIRELAHKNSDGSVSVSHILYHIHSDNSLPGSFIVKLNKDKNTISFTDSASNLARNSDNLARLVVDSQDNKSLPQFSAKDLNILAKQVPELGNNIGKYMYMSQNR